jgi:hypothetical protein
MEEVVAAPNSVGTWLAPMFLNALIGLIFTFVVFSNPVILQDFKEKQAQAVDQQVKAGKMTEAQAAQALAGMEKIGPWIYKVFGGVAAVFFSFVFPLLLALILWGLARKALGGPASYQKALEVTSLAGMINVPGAIVTMLLALVKGTMSTNPSPVLLFTDLRPDSPLFAALSGLNVFYLWWGAVLSIGLAKLGRSTFGRAAVWIFGIYFVLLVGIVGLAALRGGGK